MRPEFQRNYAQALSPDAYADADHPDFDTQSDSVSTASGIAKPVLTQNMEKVIKASRHLYTKILPELARVLDTMVTMPMDSTELTNIFHSYGVGMRHIGAVYTLAKSIYIRQLLLVEAVARSCKVLLNNTLRLNARKGKAQTIGAEARQRSTREDFFEHMDMLHEKRKAAVLDLFNLVLGSSKASTQLWSTVLADIVFQKFALTLPTATPNVSKYQSLHVPQLFLAMQYHTGAQFADHCRYDLDASAEDCILRHEDLLNYNLPKVKPLSAAPNRVMSAGFVGTLDSLAGPSLASGLYEKASFLYKLRMSLQVTNNQHYASSCDTVNTAHTAYKLGLSMYRAGKYRDAANAVMTHLKHGIMYSAMGGRMYLLLMCCHCRDTSSKTHLDKAMVAFDAAKAVFAYVLGSNHPMQAVIMCALADQYLFLGHLQHAIAVMTTAVIFTQRQLEDHGHVLTAAYQFKLAQLHMRMDVTVPAPSNVHKISAVEYLSEALFTYDRLDADGAAVTTEIIDCLYGLTHMCMLVGRMEEALDYAIRCRSVSLAKFGQKVTHKGKHASYMPNQELVLLPAASVACLMLLGDLLMSTQRCDQAVDVFMLVWNAVRRAPSHYSGIGHIYTMLTCKILGALYSRLPFPTRCLLETIAKEVEARVHPQHGIDIPGAWAKAQETVFEAMWVNQPKTYFTSVVDGVMRGEIDGNLVAEAEDFAIAGGAASSAPSEDLEAAEEQGGSGNANRLNLFALQAAVIVRLVQRKERTRKDISYNVNVTPNEAAGA